MPDSTIKRRAHTIDATEKPLGRLSVQIANLLRGKLKPDFVPYRDAGDFVIIKNIRKIKFTGKKFEQKKYFRHSGFMGGATETPLKKLFKERPNEVLKKAVWGMLPKNKLRKEMIKRLKIE